MRHRSGHTDAEHEHGQHDEHGHRGFGHFGRHRHGGGRRGGRPFDYGELRLLILSMIADQPSHGYELIKAVEERFGGSYSPSPGVIYPTLSWLDELGYATIDMQEGNRKRYTITPEGEAFLAANRQAVDALLDRVGKQGADGKPTPVLRAMHNLKMAVRLRLTSGPVDKATVEKIAGLLDETALNVEKL